MSASIVVSGIHTAAVSIDPAFVAHKRAVVEEAQLCQIVRDAFTQTAASESLRALVKIQRAVEADRIAVKNPVLNLGRAIDSAAQDFLANVTQETNRLRGLLSSYEIEQRKRAEAERKRQIEEQRRAQEAERARLAELERQRREAEEAARRAEKAATPQQATEAIKAAVVAEERVEALTVPVAQPVFAPPVVQRAEGSVVQERWTFDLIDIHALYAAHPELVQLTPKRAEILALIRSGTRSIPGLTVRKEINVGVRL